MSMLFLDKKFNVISNGALVFALIKSNIMYRKMDKTIHRNCACILPPFSAYRTQLTGKPIAPFEKNVFRSNYTIKIYITFVFTHDFCL